MPSPQPSTMPELSPGALRFFTLLQARAGEIVTYDEARQVIGSRAANFRRVAAVWVVRIRDLASPGYEIKTVRGTCYKLVPRLAA